MGDVGGQYMLGLNTQTQYFLLGFGFGFLLGVLYDVFRILRLLLHVRKRMTVLFDILYGLLCTLLTFLYFLTFHNGKILFFVLAAELLGFLVYYFSLGVVAMRISSVVVRALERFFHLLYQPFRWLFRLLHKIFHKFMKKSAAFYQKVQKNSKYHLKKKQVMRYTLKESVPIKMQKQKRKQRREAKNRKKES